MSIRLKYCLPALLQLSAVTFAASPSLAASWQTVSNYGGSGPTMTLYVPDKVDASPGIVVSLHYCGGSASNSQGWFKSLADSYGFIIIAPKSVGKCWDASPGRSGEKQAISKMVEYVIKNNKADTTKVFSAGASSGACMTQTLLASYPEVFAAGSVLAGVPVGAWTGGSECGVCSSQNPNDSSKVVTKTDQAWGDIVRGAGSSFSGTRPRVQLWHGTQDEYLNYKFLAEEVKQWKNVFGIDGDGTPGTNPTNPSGWKRKEYKDSSETVMLETNIGDGKVHDLTQYSPWTEIVKFFGLDTDTPSTGGAGGTSSTASGSSTGGKASAGGAGGTSSSSSSSKVSTGGKSSATGGTTGKASSAASGSSSGEGGTTAKSSTKSGSSAKGGASSSTDEEQGGTASSTEDTGSGGTSDETSKAQSTTAASAKGGSKSSSTTSASSSSAAGGSAPAPTGSVATAPGDDGGCSIMARDGHTHNGSLAGLAAVLIGLALRRRRQS